MSDSVDKLLDRFQPQSAPSLPHLILHHPLFGAVAGVASGKAGADFLGLDESLYLRVLARHWGELNSQDRLDPIRLVKKTGQPALATLLDGAALQAAFEPLSPAREHFHKHHWRHTCLAARLAGELAELTGAAAPLEAAFCGRFINCGELVLDSLEGEGYLALLAEAADEGEQARRESGRYGLCHGELGAALLERLGVEGRLCDALRYHQKAPAELGDASPLVKLCWLANALAAGAPVEREAGDWFALDAAGLDERRSKALREVDGRAVELDIVCTGSRLPLAPDRREEEADARCLEQLAEQARALCWFNTAGKALTSAGADEDPCAVLKAGLSDLFGTECFALYRFDHRGRKLRPLCGRPDEGGIAELEIDCARREPEAARHSLVLDCFRQGQACGTGDAAPASLAVVDRQLLRAFGRPRLHCEPVFSGARVVAVLVLGGSEGELARATGRPLVLGRVCREIPGLLRGEAAAEGVEDILRRQQAREIIHEVNNPLGIIKNYLHLLSRKQGDDESVQADIATIREEIDRIGRIVEGLGERQGPEEQEVDLNNLLEKLAHLMHRTRAADNEVELKLELDPRVPRLFTRPDLIKQVVANLMLNAMEAMPGKGVVTVRTYAIVFTGGRRYVELQVADTGPGIAPEAMESLFTFGTTSKGESHVGAGLAVTKKLCEALGGSLSCQSGGAGTIFSVLLPRPDA